MTKKEAEETLEEILKQHEDIFADKIGNVTHIIIILTILR